MKKLKVYLSIFIGLLICACNSPKNDSNKNSSSANRAPSKLTVVNIDTINLKTPNGSGIYLASYNDGKIYFLDSKFGVLNVFDTLFKPLGPYWGIGNGPYEIPNIPRKFCATKKYGTIVVSDFIFLKTEKLGKSLKKIPINYNVKETLYELQNRPNGDMHGIYEIDWSRSENRVSVAGDYIVLPLTSYHPKFNGYMHDKYYEESKPVGLFDINTGKLEKLIGKKPHIYLEKKYIPNFDQVFFDCNDTIIYLSFAADSGIFAYSTNGKLLKMFGRSHKGFNSEYPKYNGNWEEADKNYVNERSRFSSYRTIKVDKEGNTIVRHVFLNKDAGGVLQVYRNDNLIGAIPVAQNYTLIDVVGESIYGYLKSNENKVNENRIKLIRIRYQW